MSLPALLSVVFVFGSSPAREPGDRVGIGRVIDCVGNSVNYNRRVFSISFFVIHKDITLATRMAKWRKWKRAFDMLARRLLSSYILPGWRYKTSSKICKILVPSLRQVTMLLKSRFEY